MRAGVQYCTFKLDGLLLGVEVEHVQEVIRYQEMTPVPLAPRVISGLINLRGQIVTAIDLRRRLELPSRADFARPMNVVIRGDDLVSLLVDEIGDVIEIDAEVLEASPPTLVGAARDLIRGAYQLSGRLLLVLDVDRTIRVAADHMFVEAGGGKR